MKPQLLKPFALSLACGACALAQNSVPFGPPPAPPSANYENGAPAVVLAQGIQRTPEQLDQLLGPIALYPDALIALILPSATEASDVVLAARYFNGGGDAARVDDQNWDDGVKALAHYPDIVKWMDENLTWTKQIGEAFLSQPAEVMKSVQRLRAAARAAGTLVDTPQQQVLTEGEAIAIVPTQADIIYVPYYDPDIVYVSHRDYYPGPFLTFSVGYAAGFWLGYDVDWNRRRISVIDRRERERYWNEHHDWRRPVSAPGNPRWDRDPVRQPWHPNPAYVRPPHPNVTRAPTEIVRPAPASRDPQHPGVARWTPPNQPNQNQTDRGPGNRDPSAVPPPEGRRFNPTRPERSSPTPQPGQVQPLTPAPFYGRGNRGPQNDDRGGRDTQERSRPPMTSVNPPAANRFNTAPAQSNGSVTQPAAPAVRHERVAPVVAAPAPAPQAQPAPPPAAPTPQTQDEGGRGRRGGGERQN